MKLNKIILSAALLFTIVFTACEDDSNYDIGKTVINEPTWEKNIFPGADWATADPTKYGYSADLGEKIEKLLYEIIGERIDIEIERDAIKINNLREYIEKENSLLSLNPILASEWNYEKNGKLKPQDFTCGSSKKVWWKCSKGHEWQSIIANRSKGVGCPICSNKKVLSGYNDLATINPKLASEWNYEKNEKLKPQDFACGSHRKVWWKCSKGHEWLATIKSRNEGNGCPYCSGRKKSN